MKIDNSQLQTYEECPEKYRLSYVEQLTSVNKHNVPMWAGKAIHAGISAYLDGNKVIPVISNIMNQIKVEEGERLYTVENLGKAVVEWAEYMEANFGKLEVLQTERLHEFGMNPTSPPSDIDVTFQVKKDLVIKWNDGVYPVEIKSTARSAGLDHNFWSRWAYDEQVDAQIVSTLREYDSCAGLILTGIKLGYRQRAYRGEPAGFHCEVSHQEYNRTSEQLVDWIQNVWTWVEKMRKSELSGRWGRHKSMCGWCDYNDLCQSGGNEAVKESMYVKHDAFAYLKDEKELG